jgi:oligopeptide/dipeptide ABC transporter ATP-binding protein
MPQNNEDKLLVVKDLRVYFPVYKGVFAKHVADVKAVDGVSFSVKYGQTIGLVGESGCGKTTLGRTILRLLEPSSGTILFKGRDIMTFNRREKAAFCRDAQIIFQDPYSSLNPRKTVSDLVGEALLVHKICHNEKEKTNMVQELLSRVGLSHRYLNRYPHEFSGGQRQRIGIARAIALNPSLVVCDESVSALDVSVQAQVLNLMMDLRAEMGLSYVFIAHDLSVVKHIADIIAVMYLGEIVEVSPTEELFTNPQHPYTKALLSALPRPDPNRVKERVILKGEVPSPTDPPPGCYFFTRCPHVLPICREVRPKTKWLSSEHRCKCHLVDDRRKTELNAISQERRRGLQVL